MAALIYDSTTQAFKEADTPKVYSSGDSAFVDAGGKVWNGSEWVDAWGDILSTIANGSGDLPGRTRGGYYPTYNGEMSIDDNGVTLTMPTTAKALGELYIPYMIDFSQYTTMKIVYTVNFTGARSVWYPYISTTMPMTDSIDIYTPTHKGYLFDTRSASGEYSGGSYSHLAIEYNIGSYTGNYYVSLVCFMQFEAVSSAQTITIEEIKFS